jgi:hypothetical protein
MNLVSWSPCRDMEGFSDRYNRLLSDRDLIGLDDDALRMKRRSLPRPSLAS